MTVQSQPTPDAVPICPPDSNADKVVARFELRYRRFLEPNGQAIAELPEFAQSPEALVSIYKKMVFTRTFDAKAVSMQRTGQLGTYPSSLGQEAASVGIGASMRTDDVLLPTYRDHGALHWRGVTPVEMLLYWGGDERGLNWGVPKEDFPPSIPIASHTLHASGVAAAMKLRNEKRCAVCTLGDGATSKGDFYEAMNLAGVWKLPVVFIVNNNRWAISVPLSAQTASQTIAQKGLAAGIESEQADGNDAIAVRQVVGEAVEKARAGKGPSLIELMTYRLSDHTTADDASRYRPDSEVSAEWKNDPVARLRTFLGAQGWWTKADEEALLTESKRICEAAKTEYLSLPKQAATDMVDYLYAELPDALREQRRMLEGDAS